MIVRQKRTGRADILQLSGTLDGDGALGQAAGELFSVGRSRIIIDMTGVTRMTSAGVGELVTVYKKAQLAGGGVKLLRPGPEVVGLLHVCRLDEVFEVYQNEIAAEVSFGLPPIPGQTSLDDAATH